MIELLTLNKLDDGEHYGSTELLLITLMLMPWSEDTACGRNAFVLFPCLRVLSRELAFKLNLGPVKLTERWNELGLLGELIV